MADASATIGARGPRRRWRRQDNLLGAALLLTAVRCVLRYAVLPFGLPLLGLAPGISRGIVLMFDVVAVMLAVTGLWRLWAVRHPLRWRYLAAVCLTVAVVGVLRLRDLSLT